MFMLPSTIYTELAWPSRRSDRHFMSATLLFSSELLSRRLAFWLQRAEFSAVIFCSSSSCFFLMLSYLFCQRLRAVSFVTVVTTVFWASPYASFRVGFDGYAFLVEPYTEHRQQRIFSPFSSPLLRMCWAQVLHVEKKTTKYSISNVDSVGAPRETKAQGQDALSPLRERLDWCQDEVGLCKANTVEPALVSRPWYKNI